MMCILIYENHVFKAVLGLNNVMDGLMFLQVCIFYSLHYSKSLHKPLSESDEQAPTEIKPMSSNQP